MHFILISKKETFKENQINDSLLRSPNAPSIISREAIKFEISNFIIYIYPYNHIEHELYGYSYYKDDDRFLLINGIMNINNSLRNPDIIKFFNELNDSDDLFGDYQLISMDKNGNGFFKTPPLSIRQLFFYEDENCAALSTEIKLIVDGIQKFRENSFVNHFDLDFIEDSIFREWAPRHFPENTAFKDIKRVFPYKTKYFREGNIIINNEDSIQIPDWFREVYDKDKDKLYDDYYNKLVNFVEMNLLNFKSEFESVSVGLSGGMDSRLTASILSKICSKHEIPFKCQTSGQDAHPDVILAKKVAKALDVEHILLPHPNNKRPSAKEYSDYALTFYISQGDFNSKDFMSTDRKVVNPTVLRLVGMDAYKRDELSKIQAGNRWFAKRVLSLNNFFFPLFFTSYEIWFALLCAEKGGKNAYKEFIYEILKRSEPKLLDIPFAGDSLPQVDVKPYLTKGDYSMFHEKEPFLWDYSYVRKSLKPLFKKKLNKVGSSKLFLKILGLNELDYFFDEELNKIINSYKQRQIGIIECLKELKKEGSSKKYPKTKSMVTLTQETMRNDPYTSRMQIIMDFAAAANMNSFEEIERYTGLHKN